MNAAEERKSVSFFINIPSETLSFNNEFSKIAL